MSKLLEMRIQTRQDVRKSMLNFNDTKISTEAIIEFALERANMTKKQKVLLMKNIQSRLDDGEYS